MIYFFKIRAKSTSLEKVNQAAIAVNAAVPNESRDENVSIYLYCNFVAS